MILITFRSQDLTKIEIIVNDVKNKIATARYFPGVRLPSIRATAESFNVSPSTVTEAYDRLLAAGILYSRPGSGYYIADLSTSLPLKDIEPDLDRTVDPLWVSRQSLESREGLLKPGCGWLPPSWLYEDGVRRGLRKVARSDVSLISEYSTPLGLPKLRQVLAQRMGEVGIQADPNQIVLTESGTHAIDLICRFLLKPGDTVLVDDPCYFNFYALLRAHRVHVVSVPYTSTGPDPEAFEVILNQYNPRLYITNSAIHNPTGATLSPTIACRILQLASKTGLYIVEDDIFADFELNQAPRLAALEGLSKVLYIGSFSKTLSASLRCGYIAANPNLIEHLLDLKVATSFGGGQLAQAVVLDALTDSGYRKHMGVINRRLADARAQTIPKLKALGIEPCLIPKSGMFLWCRLPGQSQSADLAKKCLSHGIILAPGNVFSQTRTAESFMRFNVSQMASARIFEALDTYID